MQGRSNESERQEQRSTKQRHVGFYVSTLALAYLWCTLLWLPTETLENSMRQAFGLRPLPALTQFWVTERNGILAFPGLWTLFAVYSMVKGNASPAQLVTFASTLILALLCVATIHFIAYTLPWLPLRIGGLSGG